MARAPHGRQQLLEAARTELIVGNGRLDVDSVVKRAGLTSGALYHHFGSKTGLLAAVCDGFYEGLDGAIADRRLPEEWTWERREKQRLRHMVTFLCEDRLAALLFSGACPNAELAETKDLYIRRMSEAAARNIRHGQDLGQLPPVIDPDAAGAYVIGGLRQAIAQQLELEPRPTSEEMTALLWRLVSATLSSS